MKAETCCTKRARRGRRIAWLSLVPAAAAIALPKCPVCLAAYLSVIGLGTGVASFAAPVLRPLGLVSFAIALMVLVVLHVRRPSGPIRE